MKSLPITISDAQARSFHTDIKLSVLPIIPNHVVISQVYGGGGNANAPYTNDYVELYNPTDSTITITGWTMQYGSATGTTWTNNQPLGGTIGSHQYYLVQLAGGAVGVPLPVTPNISGGINMAAGAGKIALVKNSDPLSSGCPIGVDPDLVDFVGYGTTANCHEGNTNTPAPSNTAAIFRKNGGDTDTDQNGNDFVTGSPNPRRTEPVVELGPWVAGTDPTTDDNTIPHDASITVNFSEPVNVDASWYNINCSTSGSHNDATVAHTADFKTLAITPNTNFQFGEQCSVSIVRTAVHDQDTDDSGPDTDTLIADQNWSFTVVGAGQPAPYDPSVHLTMGNPTNAVASTGDPLNYLMMKPTYAVSYNRDKGTPNWVSWHLDNSWYGTLTRVDTFRPDPAVPADWYRVQAFDFSGTGFDRGHMTPNADRDNQNRISINQETYLMSNMVPQSPDNNQGPWAAMEGDLRTIADGGKELYIVSGPAGVGGGSSNGGTANTIANGHVMVPSATWKVVLVLPKADGDDVSRVTCVTQTIAVIMPNVQGIRNNDWHQYITTVDAVEQLTGYDFFSNLPQGIQACVESGTNGTNPPGAADGVFTTAEDSSVNVMLTALPISGSPIIYAVQNGPAHGGLSGTGANLVYTPQPDFNGSDNFTFTVTQDGRTSRTATVSLNVTPVNDAPTANGQNTTTFEDMATAISLMGSDIETLPGDLAFIITQAPQHGTLSGMAPNLTYSPGPNYNGADSFKFSVTDGGDGASPALTSSEATVNIAVVAVNDLPVVVSDQSPSYPSTQYSDAIQSITVTALDIETSAGLLVASTTFSLDGGSTQSGLPSGLSLTETAIPGVWTLAGNINEPAGTYNVNITFTDTDGGTGSTSAVISVTKENATLVISGPTAVGVDPVTGKSPGFTLNANITQEQDGALGNIGNALPVIFHLTPVGSATPAYSCNATLVTPGTSAASCTFAEINVDVYDVTATIGGSFYRGSNRSVIAVYDPSLGFVTGNGNIMRILNGETFIADFSVNLKYQKNGPALGSFTYVEHRSDANVTFTSSTMGALAIKGSESKVTGTGRLNGIDSYSFVARFIDAGEPGSNDRVGLRITDSGGNVIADLTFDPLKLSAGNIRVH